MPPGVNPEMGTAPRRREHCRFLAGRVARDHRPVTFVISLFTDNVNLYEVHNNGNWYDFGFVLGAGILFGGGLGSRRRSR